MSTITSDTEAKVFIVTTTCHKPQTRGQWTFQSVEEAGRKKSHLESSGVHKAQIIERIVRTTIFESEVRS